MANLLPKRGNEVNRAGSPNIVEDEIHVSKNNASNTGRPTRFWVRGSGGVDTLVGPFKFTAGNNISLSEDYANGEITISYQDALTFNPSQSLLATASTYTGNNPVIEVGDYFDTAQTLKVTTGSGNNESRIDWATCTFESNTTNFGGNLTNRDNVNLASGSQNYLWTPTIGTVGAPAGFVVDTVANPNGNLATRRRSANIKCYSELQHASQFPDPDESNVWFNWGWRCRAFFSTTLYTDVALMNAAAFTTNSVLNKVVQSPRTALGASNVADAVTFDLPAGGPYYLYFAHSCQVSEPGVDDYGWTPNFTLLGSGGTGWNEVSDLNSGGDGGYFSGPSTPGSNIGGQANNKNYRLWRGPNAYAGGESWTFVIS